MAAIEIQTGEILEGYLPSKALGLVRVWADLHREELLRMWKTQEFKPLPPLE